MRKAHEEKAVHVDWKRGKRKEYFVVFAKSFKRSASRKDLLCIDLEDIAKALSASKKRAGEGIY